MTETTTVECRNCKGRGTVPDSRHSAITHRRESVNRKCRPCKGAGRITPQEPQIESEPVSVETLDWMLGWMNEG